MYSVLSATVNPFAVQEMAASILALTVFIIPLLLLQFVRIVIRTAYNNAELLKNIRRADRFAVFMNFYLWEK